MSTTGLNDLISEDIISEEEDYSTVDLLESEAFKQHDNSYSINELHSTTFKEDDGNNSLHNFLKLDTNDVTRDVARLKKYNQPFAVEKPSRFKTMSETGNLKYRTPLHKKLISMKRNTEKQRGVITKLRIPSLLNSESFDNLSDGVEDENEKFGEKFENNLSDNTELENKINGTLLDMLQNDLLRTFPNTGRSRIEVKQTEDILKFITIHPSRNSDKMISLKVKGKTCRSNRPLSRTEIRIIKQLINQENTHDKKDNFYKNVYYDPESDTNIRYEVRRRKLKELDSHSTVLHPKLSKTKLKLNQQVAKENDGTIKDERTVAQIKPARTRFKRISRLPRHIDQNHKRFKHLGRMNDGNDDHQNTTDYDNYGPRDDLGLITENCSEICEKNLYGPLKSNKMKFSSLSTCPTCGKVYLGYRRMEIHFQEYPDHKNEDLLKQLLEIRKRESNKKYGLSNSPPTNADVIASCDSPARKCEINRRTKAHSLRNPELCIKELLSQFEIKEVVKHTAPIVAEVLDPWEYLVMRSKQQINREGTLFLSILKEVQKIVDQARNLPSHKLKPLNSGSDTTVNKFKIEEHDILRYMLGISPGTYVLCDPDKCANAEQTRGKEIAVPTTLQPPNVIMTDNKTNDELLDAAIAECLAEDMLHSESITELNRVPLSDCNITAISKYDDALEWNAVNDTDSTINETPIISTNNELNVIDIPIQYVVSDMDYSKYLINDNSSPAL